MKVARVPSLAVAGLVIVALLSPARIVHAQTQPAPAQPTAGPASSASQPPAAQSPARPPITVTPQDATIVRPLVEIGRVRARTPYCAALASARRGIDAAITFEYQVPILADDLRRWRYDSRLHQALAMKRTAADLATLYDLALAGRDEVRALRAAANADGVDEAKRKEMLAVADAVDGAKERQKELAKMIARALAIYSEAPVHTVVTTSEDDLRSANPFTDSTWNPSGQIGVSPSVEETPAPSAYQQFHPPSLAEQSRSHALFRTFHQEDLIRDDMETAAKHAKRAMELGGCAP